MAVSGLTWLAGATGSAGLAAGAVAAGTALNTAALIGAGTAIAGGGGGGGGDQAKKADTILTGKPTVDQSANTRAAQAAGTRTRTQQARRTGRFGTILTGPSGLSGEAPTRNPALLGG